VMPQAGWAAFEGGLDLALDGLVSIAALTR
jgi:hypothetical protein